MNLADYVIGRCRREDATGCLVWRGAINNCGIPVFRLACCGTRDPRRILWEAAGLPFKPRLVFVEPHCAEGHRCIEPTHMARMTRRQSAQRPGVMSSGPRHSAAIVAAARRRKHVVLNLGIVREIRARYAECANAAQIAREFGIDHGHAHRICTHRAWREPSPWAI
jgi:hypothetical protein